MRLVDRIRSVGSPTLGQPLEAKLERIAEAKPLATAKKERIKAARKAKRVSSDRNADRHSPGYMAEYMRKRRAK